MKCPKCDSEMEEVVFQEISVDRCSNCKGLWFDCFKAEELKVLKGSEAIDTGDPDVGKEYNKMSSVDCPKCHTKMIPIVDNEQPHIWYEGCSVCYGRFFDAGEFKDYKEKRFLDFFRRFFSKKRSGDPGSDPGLAKEDWQSILK